MVERITKVNDLIGKEVATILKDDLDIDADVFITVVRVVTSHTLEHATVWISILPETRAKEALAQIKLQIYDIQQALNKRLVMRKIPKLLFKIDTTEAYAEKIENLLKTR